MAEILLSLTIIGVVAAITLPSLTGNINERTWNTQRKALYARMSQALALMPSLNGYGQFAEATEEAEAMDTAAETFVTDGLSKVLKINNICDTEHLKDCGIPAKFNPYYGGGLTEFPTNMHGLAISNISRVPDTNVAAFETQNGESMLVYYNPNCMGDMQETSSFYPHRKICANFVYDLNGTKGPNTVGKDIGFITVFYPTDSNLVAPMMAGKRTLTTQYSYEEAGTICRNRGGAEGRVPNREELVAIFFNKVFTGLFTDRDYWSSTVFSSSDAWVVATTPGVAAPCSRDTKKYVECVQR